MGPTKPTPNVDPKTAKNVPKKEKTQRKGEGKNKNKEPDVRVLVLGLSGTGKSNFINQASGSKLAVSDGLKSCTTKVQESELFEFENHLVTLVDTPGFDDTTVPNTDILQMIADYLADLHKRKKPLNGIIYMHRISDVRVGGTSNRSLKMLLALTGQDAYSSIAFTTTMWDTVPANTAEARLAELRTHAHIAPILAHGGRLEKHTNTPDSAQRILHAFLDTRAPTLQIQRELAGGKKGILLTAAGRELDQELAAEEEKFRRQLADLQNERAGATPASARGRPSELAEATREIEAGIRKLQQERKRMAKGQKKELARVKSEVRGAERELAKVQRKNSKQERKTKKSGSWLSRLCGKGARHMD